MPSAVHNIDSVKKKYDKSLLCMEPKSTATGYLLLNQISAIEDVDVIEASILAPNRFLLLAHGSPEDVEVMVSMALNNTGAIGQSEVIDHEVMHALHADLLPSLYSLNVPTLHESLVVIEAASTSGLLHVTHHLLRDYKVMCIEQKLLRGFNPFTAIGFLTGTAAECLPAAEEARMRLKSTVREGRVELIEKPAAKFRDFFQLSTDTV